MNNPLSAFFLIYTSMGTSPETRIPQAYTFSVGFLAPTVASGASSVLFRSVTFLHYPQHLFSTSETGSYYVI